MGSFVFKWEHPANEVHVTGTFDGWSKSVKLDKIDGIFQRRVELKDASQKVYYKFFVDNVWVTNETAPQELDERNNMNNFLTPDQISKTQPAAVIMNSVIPSSTTAALAGAVPIEKRGEPASNVATYDLPGAFPSTLAGTVPEQIRGEPAPAVTPYDVPGAFPSTVANTVQAEERGEPTPAIIPSQAPGYFPPTPADDNDKLISVNPLPAADGALNPIKLEPGQPVPDMNAADSVLKNVKLDKASYEQSDALPGIGGHSVNSPWLNSVAPDASTAALAGEVPLIVQESQRAAGAGGGASANPVEVNEKATVEQELLAKVPEARSTAEGVAGFGTTKTENTSAPLGALASVGTTFLASALSAKDAVVHSIAPTTEGVAGFGTTKTENTSAPLGGLASVGTNFLASALSAKDAVVHSIAPSSEGVAGTGTTKTENTSAPLGTIASVGASVGASLFASAVAAKDAVAQKTVPLWNQAAPAVSATAASLPESIKQALPVRTQQDIANQAKEKIAQYVSPKVPVEVKESIARSGILPEAAGNTKAVIGKAQVEAELLGEVKQVPPTAIGPITSVTTDSGIPTITSTPLLAQQEIANQMHISPQVPAKVQESIAQSGVLPEAAGNTKAVGVKSQVEAELLSEVERVSPITTTPITSALTNAGASTISPAPLWHQQGVVNQTKESITQHISAQVPAKVQESIAKSGLLPEAAGNTKAVGVKSQVEAELLSEVERVLPIATGPILSARTDAIASTIAPAPFMGSAMETTTPKHVTAPAASVTSPTAGAMTAKATKSVLLPTTVVTSTASLNTTSALPSAAVTADSADRPSMSEPGTPSSSKISPDSPAGSARKRHRLSAMFNKLKQKVAQM